MEGCGVDIFQGLVHCPAGVLEVFQGQVRCPAVVLEVFQGLVHCPVVVLKFFHTGRPRSSHNLVLFHDLYNRFCEAQSRTEPLVRNIFTYLHIDIPIGKGISGTFRPGVDTTPVPI